MDVLEMMMLDTQCFLQAHRPDLLENNSAVQEYNKFISHAESTLSREPNTGSLCTCISISATPFGEYAVITCGQTIVSPITDTLLFDTRDHADEFVTMFLLKFNDWTITLRLV